jgi:hypothetical protein
VQFGAFGEMRKVVEWQGLRRGERIFLMIFLMSAAGNGRNKIAQVPLGAELARMLLGRDDGRHAVLGCPDKQA